MRFSFPEKTISSDKNPAKQSIANPLNIACHREACPLWVMRGAQSATWLSPALLVVVPYHRNYFFLISCRESQELLARAANRIVNEVAGVNRVVYDITSKSPANIE
jgi:hypothetical protein